MLTVILQDADFLLSSLAVAVIVAVPLATAVTFPEESTVATFVLELFHSSVLFVALDGDTVAVSCTVCPLLFSVAEVLFKATLLTLIAGMVTDTPFVLYFPYTLVLL